MTLPLRISAQFFRVLAKKYQGFLFLARSALQYNLTKAGTIVEGDRASAIKTLLILFLLFALICSVFANFHLHEKLKIAERDFKVLQSEMMRLQEEKQAYKAAIEEIRRKATEEQLYDILRLILGFGF